MVKIIAFDLDGVLINSHNLQKHALKTAYEKVYQRQEEPPYESFFLHSGNSLENIFRLLGLSDKMVPIYKKVSQENIQMIVLHQGIRELLSDLSERNVSCSICTGKDQKRTKEILRYLKIDIYFDLVISSDIVNSPKPNPESLFKIKDYYAAKNEEIILVGDGINDIRCAKAAGIKSIAVTWGDGTKSNLLLEQPTDIAFTTDDLRKILYRYI